MDYSTLTQLYVNPSFKISRPIVAVAVWAGAFCLASTAMAQGVPADDGPPTPVEVVESIDEAKLDSIRAVTVTRNGAVVGIPQTGGAAWESHGPAPSIIGQVENVRPDLDMDGFPDDEVTGAVHIVLPHPTDPDVVYVGAVNGGVWKTTNAQALSPTWVPLTDFMPSLSIGALEFDPTDPTHQTLVAGVGRFSSFSRTTGGALTGIYKTTNGGATWTHIDGGGALTNQNISAVYARGNFIMVASTEFWVSSNSISFFNSGILRSFDGGQTFELIGQTPTPTTFRTGRVFDMEGHRNDPATVFAAVTRTNSTDSNGVYRSDDFGGTWTRVSNVRMNDLLTNGGTSNVEISIFDDNVNTQVIYCAILNEGQLTRGGVFRSTNRGVTWAELPVPVTNENGTEVGTNPTHNPEAGAPGGQGATHFSIEADSAIASVVYVAGDRQPAGPNDCCGFPNSIGATDFSGRLFRGDVFSNLSDKWSHLTHSPNVITKPLGGTANFSAPHADSREMAFDANGVLLDADDGGVYKRTLPNSKQGDWFSINGNLAVTEIHDIAWDSMSQVMMAGNQDTGTTYQEFPGSKRWISFRTGDGGDVLVDDKTAFSSSTRYSSFHSLGDPRRSLWLDTNVLVSDESIAAAGFVGSPLFRNPLALNNVDASRIVASSVEFINESLNRGNNFAPLPVIVGEYFAHFQANALDYGGMIDGSPDADLVWAGGISGQYFELEPEEEDPPPVPPRAPNVLVRVNPNSGMTLTNYPGRGSNPNQRQPVDLEMDPNNGRICYVADQFGDILRTKDLGNTWENVSVGLGDVGVLYQIEIVNSNTSRYLFVCADMGVFYTDIGSLDVDPLMAKWRELGTNLPNAPVWDIEHEPSDDLIAIGTMGRGGWLYRDLSAVIDPLFPRAAVFVDSSFNGASLGTEGAPFRTIAEALPRVLNGGTLFLAPGTYPESHLKITKRVTLVRRGAGVVTIR